MNDLKKAAGYILQWEELKLQLLPEKAVYIEKLRSLLIADPHFGKAAHFRKAGIPVSEKLHIGDLMVIQKLIQTYNPEHLYFLGDLFHSDLNIAWNDLETFAEYHPGTNFHLIKGNHDILPEAVYRSDIWKVHLEPLIIGNLILSHEPMTNIPLEGINLCGHIHPGISLYGTGRQKLTLPCFFVTPNQIILPAFGRFTGLYTMKCGKNDNAFVIAEKKVIPVNFID
ncbi:ligase-associated DNA damage response endonuclease PdeM [Aquiflexum lacus]|uniref:ligase-associated DNA damage response endonuclease PdeM n=1 Tax=Aquiflexum lacus TaxID=2483805 RepID=UPI001893B6F2|nr:ligase-associated DNA damage response endonuclease PdeM [Aquiflexum lacus]